MYNPTAEPFCMNEMERVYRKYFFNLFVHNLQLIHQTCSCRLVSSTYLSILLLALSSTYLYILPIAPTTYTSYQLSPAKITHLTTANMAIYRVHILLDSNLSSSFRVDKLHLLTHLISNCMIAKFYLLIHCSSSFRVD